MSIQPRSSRKLASLPEEATGTRGEKQNASGLNMGCGTLIVLFLLVATAGKFLPHRNQQVPPGQKATTAAPEIKKTERGKGREKEVPAPASPKTGLSRSHTPEKDEPNQQPQKSLLPESQLLNSLNLFLSGAGMPLNQAVLSGHHAAENPPSGRPSTPGIINANDIKAERKGPAETPSSGQVQNKNHIPRSEESGTKSVAQHQQDKATLPRTDETRSGSDLPFIGNSKPRVFNSQWDGSVEPVKRYLRQHLHDAESVEIVEWGKVMYLNGNYQVRCSFRSRNVLGNTVTLRKLFIMSREGEVIDVRD